MMSADLGMSALFTDLPPSAPRVLGLLDRFLVPPFSTLDARQGYWQDRKAAWIAMGIQSELGRAEGARAYSMALDHAPGDLKSGTMRPSIFDPVLCELAYRWWCPPTGVIVDPFAGGSVRGIVAGVLGRTYVGVDLNAEQVAANYEQAAAMGAWVRETPQWIVGDSRTVLAEMPHMGADLVFTCPPYYDLEVYSKDPRDLSVMPTYEAFRYAYTSILNAAVAHLKADSFACVVIGNIRDGRGIMRDLVGDTVAAMRAAGAAFYNEGILLTAVGTAAVRAPQFARSRKLAKTHQNVLLFVKGDPKRASERCGAITVDQFADMTS